MPTSGNVPSELFRDRFPAAVGHGDAGAIAVRGLAESCDSNRLLVKKNQMFSEFLSFAVPFRRGGGGDEGVTDAGKSDGRRSAKLENG